MKRKECYRFRRLASRAYYYSMKDLYTVRYREYRKQRTLLIRVSKRAAAEVDADRCGRPYTLIVKRVLKCRTLTTRNAREVRHVIEGLFPHRDVFPLLDRGDVVTSPLFTRDKIDIAAWRIRADKAPGSDLLPSLVVREAARAGLEALLEVYNACLK